MRNDLPALWAGLAATDGGGGTLLEWEVVAAGGASLRQHLNKGTAGLLLAERGWLLVATRSPELVLRGMENLDEAIALDPLDPYGLAYRAVVLATVADRPDDAAVDLTRFTGLAGQPADLVDLLVVVGLLEPQP